LTVTIRCCHSISNIIGWGRRVSNVTSGVGDGREMIIYVNIGGIDDGRRIGHVGIDNGRRIGHVGIDNGRRIGHVGIDNGRRIGHVGIRVCIVIRRLSNIFHIITQ